MKTTFGIRVGRAVLFILRPLIWLLFPYKMIGKENIPKTKEPLIVACNHISMLDPVFLLIAMKRPVYFMAKEELFQNRFVGWLLRTFFGVFPVSRGKGDTTAINTAFSVLDNNGALGIFPEGTRSKDGTLGPAKAGAALIMAKAQCPMLPCAVFTKSGQVKLFHKSTVVFGKTLTAEDLHLAQERPDLRYASRAIMANIAGMIEENKQ